MSQFSGPPGTSKNEVIGQHAAFVHFCGHHPRHHLQGIGRRFRRFASVRSRCCNRAILTRVPAVLCRWCLSPAGWQTVSLGTTKDAYGAAAKRLRSFVTVLKKVSVETQSQFSGQRSTN